MNPYFIDDVSNGHQLFTVNEAINGVARGRAEGGPIRVLCCVRRGELICVAPSKSKRFTQSFKRLSEQDIKHKASQKH